MLRRWWSFAVMLWAVSAAAQPAPAWLADTSLARQFHVEVELASPEAAEAFDQGTAARDEHRFEDALAAYRRAIELAPGVDHPHRRACSMLVHLGRTDEAIAECETALQLDPDSPYNKISIVIPLAQRGRPGDRERALRLAREAASQLPADPSALGNLCQMLLDMHNRAELGPCVERLLAVNPKGEHANYVGALSAIDQGQLVVARRRLDEARAAGFGEEPYREMLAKIEAAQARGHAARDLDDGAAPDTFVLRVVWWTFGVWITVMGVLLGAGYALSRLTLRAVGKMTAAGANVRPGTVRAQLLHKLYKLVLLLYGVYFYLSLPIVLTMIVATGAGEIFAFITADVIPFTLVVCIAIAVIAIVGVVILSLAVRVEPPSLGYRIDLDRQPRLRGLLQEVAGVVGTRRVSAVYLTPGTNMAVIEQAGLWSSLLGKRVERSLIMGIGLFEGMTQLQLRSVLAHEHGHFRNTDTAGGGFALAVRRSLFVTLVRIARSGAADSFNPVWWFLCAYHRTYRGVSQGASRLQEVLADRWAIQAYGSAAFVAGYRHLVARSVQLDHQIDATLKEVIDTGRALPNLYQYRSQAGRISERNLTAAIDKAMTREPHAYDSHPSPHQRIAWAEALAVERDAQPSDDEPIWTLFDDRSELEREMTAEVRGRIFANHGIEIAGTAAAATATTN